MDVQETIPRFVVVLIVVEIEVGGMNESVLFGDEISGWVSGV